MGIQSIDVNIFPFKLNCHTKKYWKRASHHRRPENARSTMLVGSHGSQVSVAIYWWSNKWSLIVCIAKQQYLKLTPFTKLSLVTAT